MFTPKTAIINVFHLCFKLFREIFKHVCDCKYSDHPGVVFVSPECGGDCSEDSPVDGDRGVVEEVEGLLEGGFLRCILEEP